MGRWKLIWAWLLTVFLLSWSAAGETLIPGGQLVGVAVRSEGLIYVGASDLGSTPSPARLAGLRSGDVILAMNGEDVVSPAAFARAVGEQERVVLTVARGEREMEIILEPGVDPRDGQRRIGAWVRGSAAGVGTLTYIDPHTGRFGALGHAIEDPDARVTIPVREGLIYESAVTEVTKGEKGAPGQLSGDFVARNRPVGTISANGASGISGTYVSANVGNPLFPEGIETAEAAPGRAQLMTNAVNGEMGLYDIRIVRAEKGVDTRSLTIEVTDQRLLAATGGIVQGMSGSPIVQNGYLVGAVTHVLVDDPAKGYGIRIEKMLDAA